MEFICSTIRVHVHDSINVPPSDDINHPSRSVPSEQHLLYVTTASSNPAVTTPING